MERTGVGGGFLSRMHESCFTAVDWTLVCGGPSRVSSCCVNNNFGARPTVTYTWLLFSYSKLSISLGLSEKLPALFCR